MFTKNRRFPRQVDINRIVRKKRFKKLFFTCNYEKSSFPRKVDIKVILNENQFFKKIGLSHVIMKYRPSRVKLILRKLCAKNDLKKTIFTSNQKKNVLFRVKLILWESLTKNYF